MKNEKMSRVRQAYCRPETWAVPCEFHPLMGPSVHADGYQWHEEDGDLLDWNNGGLPPGYESESSTFQSKSVWDASVKELQSVVIDID